MRNLTSSVCHAALGAAVCAALAIGGPAKASGLMIGSGGHDAWSSHTWQTYNAEQAFQIMNQRNMRTYRVDVFNNAAGYAALTKLVALGAKYNITIRPLLDVSSGKASDAYTITKMFASSIHVWELGNELGNLGQSMFTTEINLMLQARAGVMQAAAETKQPLQTVINVTAVYGGNAGLNNAGTSYPFIDQAIAMGLQFDYISFHYYPSATDFASGWAKFYMNPLRQYQKPVFFNETNCEQIYAGDDGNSAACNTVLASTLALAKNNYGDFIKEVDLYEIIDDPSTPGPSGHFGIMYNLNSPKVTINTATQYVAGDLPFTVPVASDTHLLSNGDFVTEVWEATLNRVPTASELSAWTGWLNIGGNNTRARLSGALMGSPEFVSNAALMDNQAYVARLYLGLLGRPIDPASLATYGSQLDTNVATRSTVMHTIAGSAEAHARTL